MFFKNEDGVSEVVGAMMILMILVIVLGLTQVYEVPKWNKEIERQQFERAYSDFSKLRSDLELASARNIPMTSDIQMGVRYPQRYMLHNPGPGAYGMMSMYPVNITISYRIDNISAPITATYTSYGIRYDMEGILETPALVYEHGILIKDFGNWNYSEDTTQKLAAEDSSNIFIPFIQGSVDSSSSMEKLTFNEFPISQDSYTMPGILSMNVTLETRYPNVWANLNPSGSPNFKVNNTTGTIRITNISGIKRPLKLPPASFDPAVQNKLFSGMVTIDTSATTSTTTTTTTSTTTTLGITGAIISDPNVMGAIIGLIVIIILALVWHFFIRPGKK